MKKVILKFLVPLLSIVLILGFVSTEVKMHSLASPALSKYGSRSNEVRQIQEKLKNLGLYSGNVDGIYGAKTQNAVKIFQKQKGLVVDGIAGPKTLKALGIGSSSSNTSSNISNDNNINLLAKVISAEARGEPYEGQVAVGGVIMNRIEHPSFPNTLAGVVYQKGAFTCMTDGQINSPITDSAYRAARDALNGLDPSGGAIYYYNPATATNKWIRSRPVIKTIGKHIFCL